MSTQDTAATIKRIKPGQVYWREIGGSKIMTRRTAEGYQVECDWQVMEGYGDDPLSSTYQPLGTGVPFVGIRVNAETATDAAEIMDYMDGVASTSAQHTLRGKYPHGEIIGNVSRDPA